ncbi:hypothetical protein Tsubulata_000596, partial [Turnera subulata]
RCRFGITHRNLTGRSCSGSGSCRRRRRSGPDDASDAHQMQHKQLVVSETYLGVHILRFYSRCPNCSAEFVIKTDPKNCDYVVESGATRLPEDEKECTNCSAEFVFRTDPKNSDYVLESRATRNFEPWRAEDVEAGHRKRRRGEEEEEMGDALKGLESRTRDSKREMDDLAALEELKSIKSTHAGIDRDSMLEGLQRRTRAMEEKDEALIRSIFLKRDETVRRISDGDDGFNASEISHQ